ncbi:MAG: hypothetical protein KDD29_10630, partial [Flavobacteriales bacterium]|nr:hypothetical protein [Flavobacteriales bacterium]
MNKIILIYILIFNLIALSEEATDKTEDTKEPTLWEKTVEVTTPYYLKGKEIVQKTNESINKTKLRRGEKSWGALGHFSYIDTWVPGKLGFHLFKVEDESTTWEFEFSRGSISYEVIKVNLIHFWDHRFSLYKRSFSQRNSLNFRYGIYYNTFGVVLGDDMLRYVSNAEEYELVEVKTAGITWGLGNRWQTGGKFTWGIDWFTL